MKTDGDDPNDGVQYHLEVGGADVAETVLLPGDPDRIDVIAEVWDRAEMIADHREYRTATGSYEGIEVSATSTGIGSPSAAIAVEELARAGARTFLRVGSCGAIQDGMAVGDMVITTGAVRQEGTSEEYVRSEYPAAADYRVVAALVAAADRLDYEYHLGVTASTDSFYVGQDRSGYEGYEPPASSERYAELREAGVLNTEMEAAAVLTLANVYDLRAGAVCTVYANRVTGEFQVSGDTRAAETASLATVILAEMDADADEAGADCWHPGL